MGRVSDSPAIKALGDGVWNATDTPLPGRDSSLTAQGHPEHPAQMPDGPMGRGSGHRGQMGLSHPQSRTAPHRQAPRPQDGPGRCSPPRARPSTGEGVAPLGRRRGAGGPRLPDPVLRRDLGGPPPRRPHRRGPCPGGAGEACEGEQLGGRAARIPPLLQRVPPVVPQAALAPEGAVAPEHLRGLLDALPGAPLDGGVGAPSGWSGLCTGRGTSHGIPTSGLGLERQLDRHGGVHCRATGGGVGWKGRACETMPLSPGLSGWWQGSVGCLSPPLEEASRGRGHVHSRCTQTPPGRLLRGTGGGSKYTSRFPSPRRFCCDYPTQQAQTHPPSTLSGSAEAPPVSLLPLEDDVVRGTPRSTAPEPMELDTLLGKEGEELVDVGPCLRRHPHEVHAE